MHTIFNALPDGRMIVFDSDAMIFYKSFPEEIKALQTSGIWGSIKWVHKLSVRFPKQVQWEVWKWIYLFCGVEAV